MPIRRCPVLSRRLALRAIRITAPFVLTFLLTIAAEAQLYWDTNGATAGSGGATPSGVWDNSTNNWNDNSGGTTGTSNWSANNAAIFSAGTDAIGAFTVTVAANTTISGVTGITFEEGTITIAAGNSSSILNIGPIGATINAIAGTHTIGAVIDGSSQVLTKQGAGTVILTGANNFGQLDLFAGEVRVSSNANLGAASGSMRFWGGTIGVDTSFSTSRNFTLDNGNGGFNIIGASTTLTLTTGLARSSFYTLTKSGAGTLDLTASSLGSGFTTIDAGTVRLTHASGLGSSGQITINAGTLELPNIALPQHPLVLNNGATLLGSGTSSYGNTGGSTTASVGDGASVNLKTAAASDLFTFITELRHGDAASLVTISGPGTIVFAKGTTAAANAYQGSFVLSSGTLRITDRLALATTGLAEGRPLTLQGGTLDLRSDTAVDYRSNTIVSGNTTILADRKTAGAGVQETLGTLNIGGSTLTVSSGASVTSGTQTVSFGSTTLSGNATFNVANSANAATQLTLSGVSESGANRTLTKTGSGMLLLTGAGSYTGATTVSAGVLNIQNATALGTTAAGTTVNTGAALQIQGGIAVGAEALTLNGSGISSDGALRNISGNNSWAGSVTLGSASTIASDSGTLTLSNTLTNGGFGLTAGGAGNVTANGIISGTGTLTKTGPGTLTLSAANTYTGTTTVNGGTLAVTGSLNGATGTALTFTGTGTFNSNEAAGLAQGMGTLTFSGGEGTVQSTYGGSSNTSLTFSSLAPVSPTATGNFVVSGGTNGTTNKIVLTGQATGLIDPGVFFGGNEFAYYDAAGYVRGINYGVDPNTTFSTGGVTLVGDHVKTNGNITDQGTERLETIHIAANITLTLGSNKQVTTNAILKTGNVAGGATITNGDSLKADNNANLVIRTDQINDGLTIITPIIANGTNALTKSGLGLLTLTGANTYTGGTNFVGGTLNVGSANAVGTIGNLSFYGGTLQYSASNATDYSSRIKNSLGPISIDTNGRSVTYASVVDSSNTGGLTKLGTGTLTLAGVNTYLGGSTINAGTVAVNSSASLGAISGGATINAGTLEVATGFSTTRAFTLGNAASTFQIDPAQIFTVTSAIGGTGALNKTGTGAMVLSGGNTYSGGTNVNAGTLQISANERLENAGALTVSGGTFDVQTFSETVGGVTLASGSITGTGAGTLTGSSYTMESGSVSAILGGTAALTKNTSGTVTLNGANTFTGSTTVNAGTLTAAASSGSALASISAITVNVGGTLLLGASNQIRNAAPMTLAGGTFAKGNFAEGTASSVGVGALTLTASGSHIDFQTGTVGVLTFASFSPGANTLTIDNWTGTASTIGNASTDRLIFNSDQASNLSNFQFTGFGAGAAKFALGGGYFEVVPLAPVPEPATYVVGILTLVAMGYHQRRRWRGLLPL